MTTEIIADKNAVNQADDLSDIKIIGMSSFTAVASALFYDFHLAKAASTRAITCYGLIPPAETPSI